MSVHRPTVVHPDWFRLVARSWKPKPVRCSACAGKGYRVVGFASDRDGGNRVDIVGTCPTCKGRGREGSE